MGAVAATAVATPDRKRLRFEFDVPFVPEIRAATKDSPAGLILSGYASTWVLDRDGEYIDPRAFDNSLEPYLQKNPMVLWQHNMDWPLGIVQQAAIDGNGMKVKVFIPEPVVGEEPWKFTAYYSIKNGIVRTFSIGGFFTRDMQGGRILVTEVELLEISCVSIPSNPDSIFEAMQKAIKGGAASVSDLPSKAVSQMQQLLGMKAMTDPELLLLQEKGQLDERYELLAGIYRKSRRLPPSRETWEEAKGEPDPRKRLVRVLDVMQAVNGQVEFKQGRVLSKANESKIRQVGTLLGEADQLLIGLLAQLDADVQMEEAAANDGVPTAADEPKGVHDYKGDGGPCAICGEPPSHADHNGGKSAPIAVEIVKALGYVFDGNDWVEPKGVAPSPTKRPIADREKPWDGGGAHNRILAKLGTSDGKPTAAYDACHFYVSDKSSDKVGDRHLLYCDVVGGTVTIIPRGVFACAVIMQGGRGGRPKDMSDADVPKVQKAMATVYGWLADKFSDDTIKPPWAS